MVDQENNWINVSQEYLDIFNLNPTDWILIDVTVDKTDLPQNARNETIQILPRR